jgi:hypothetical protein
VFPACDGAGCPDIFNDQEGHLFIDAVMTGLRWNFSTCLYEGATSTDCATVIVVRFWYDDTFSFPHWDTIGPDPEDCVSYTDTRSIYTQEWVCYYVRQVATGQYFAEGTYSLLRCDYPAPQPTVKSTGGWTNCLSGGTACSSGYGIPVTVPTTWRPPPTITLTRVS